MMHLHIEHKRMTYQNIVCFNWISFSFFLFVFVFVPLFYLFGLTLWNEILPLLAITSIDLNWYQLPTAEIHSEIFAYDCHRKWYCFARHIFQAFVQLNWQSVLKKKSLNRSTADFSSSFDYLGWNSVDIRTFVQLIASFHFASSSNWKHEIVRNSFSQSIDSKDNTIDEQQPDGTENKAELSNFSLLSSHIKYALSNG